MTDITNNIIKLPKTAVALGFFDGLHLGHMQVILETFKYKDLMPAMFTFHSDAQLPKREKIENLLDNDMKLEKLTRAGLRYIYSPDFESVRGFTGEEFVQKILINIMNARVVVCGFDFRLGNDGCDSKQLYDICKGFGITVVVIPPFSLDGCIIHSSAIKNLIKTGNVKKANRLLGYNFTISGTVIEGNRLGRRLGSPTINQVFPKNIVMPLFGAYKSVTEVNGVIYPSVTNIGVKPTVDYKSVPLAETHILNFDGDLYGMDIKVSLLSFIRPEKKFDSVESLKQQLESDKREAVSKQ